jgi:glucosyl-3-phosphoglycerate synthase
MATRYDQTRQWQLRSAQCKHALCKTNTLQYVLTQYRINMANTIVVGGNENDICMVRNAGIGVFFCSDNPLLNLRQLKGLIIGR